MKSFFIAISIFAILLIGGFVFNYCLDNTSEKFLGTFEQISAQVEEGDFEGANKHAQELSEYVDNKKPLMSSILDHGNIDEIEKEISGLLGYTENEDKANSEVCLKKLEHMFKHLPENYKLRLQNIL